MKTMMGKFLTVGVALTLWVSSVAAGPLGDIEVQGEAHLTTVGGSQSIRLRNTTYTWFSGDRVVTGDGAVSLMLGGGSSLAIGPHSELTLVANGGLIDAALTRGSLVYLLGSGTTVVRVNGAQLLASGMLGAIESGDGGAMTALQGDAATAVLERSRLRLTGTGLSASCVDPRLCGRERPKSVSH